MISILTQEQLPELLLFHDSIFEYYESNSLPLYCRKNTKEMLQSCLSQPNKAIAFRVDNEIKAIAILYVPQKESSDNLLPIAGELSELSFCNYKLALVYPTLQGRGLQVTLGNYLETLIEGCNYDCICATVHPDNTPSIKSLITLGYKLDRTVDKYDSIRHIFIKHL